MINNTATEPPDSEKARCYDCRFLKGAVSWWCTNDEAKEARGTSIPGICQCPYWEPAKYKPPRKSLLARLWKIIIK